MAIDLTTLTIKKAHDHLTNGDFSSVELTQNYLDALAAKNPDINAYLEVFGDALAGARAADRMLEANSGGVLTGIPVAMKDNILIKGKVASCASKILEHYVATYDSTVTEKLKKEGVVFLGRANMDEFAMGSSNENSAYGPVKNPVDTSRAPGGSSGGPAAAVAMNGALAALGSDTGGSIRQPASFCGVVGLKPTYGAVSRYGLVALASSLDVIGPITKTVEDSELLFNAISAYDPMDSTSYPMELRKSLQKKVGSSDKQKVIGIPYHLFNMEGVEKDVIDNFNTAIEVFKKQGYTIREIELPYAKYALAVYYIIQPAETSTNLARFDGVRFGLLKEGENLLADYMNTRGEGFGRETRRRIMLGTYVLSAGYYDAYYNKARAVRGLIEKDFTDAFADVDVIMTPTSPTPAFKLGEKVSDPLSMYLSDIFTVPINIAGVPAISIPSGTVSREGHDLPLGLQIIAPHFGEEALFKVGKDYEIHR